MRQQTAVVFGGTGFLGHAVVQALASRGYLVRVPTREPDKALDLKVMGAVGQIVPLRASTKTDASVAAILDGADIVVNLIGILAEKGSQTFQALHVETAARLARLARAEGVKAFVHVSALGANAQSPSRYARTKAIGEEAVRAFFPEAVILRPSVMFGARDKFLNRFALMARYLPFLPLIGGGHTRFQPVAVGDVAAAVLAAIESPAAQGRIYALGGPKTYTFKELLEKLVAATGSTACFVSVPWTLAKVKAFFLEKLPDPLLTRDQVILLQTDNVVSLAQSAGQPVGTFEDLNLRPAPLEPFLDRLHQAQT